MRGGEKKHRKRDEALGCMYGYGGVNGGVTNHAYIRMSA